MPAKFRKGQIARTAMKVKKLEANKPIRIIGYDVVGQDDKTRRLYLCKDMTNGKKEQFCIVLLVFFAFLGLKNRLSSRRGLEQLPRLKPSE